MSEFDQTLRGIRINKSVDFVCEICCNCGIPFMMLTDKKEWLLNHPGTEFFCPNGHSQHYIGKTEAQKLKEELAAERSSSQRQLSYLQNKFNQESAERKKLAKILKRVHNGLCPCCNRHFTNLENHILTKHPDILKREKPNPLHTKIENKK